MGAHTLFVAHFKLRTPITSYFEHNKLAKVDRVLAALETGDVALVSDAGTPNLSDPGYELVRAVLAAGRDVVAIPGPSALLAALVASGLPTDAFAFHGFLPPRLLADGVVQSTNPDKTSQAPRYKFKSNFTRSPRHFKS